MQRYFTRRLYAKCNIRATNYLARLMYLNLDSLERRRLCFDLKMVFKICQGYVDLTFDDFFVPAYRPGLRGHNYKLFTVFSRLNVCKFSFANRIVPIWNHLDTVCVNSSSVTMFSSFLSRIDLSTFCKFDRFL